MRFLGLELTPKQPHCLSPGRTWKSQLGNPRWRIKQLKRECLFIQGRSTVSWDSGASWSDVVLACCAACVVIFVFRTKLQQKRYLLGHRILTTLSGSPCEWQSIKSTGSPTCDNEVFATKPCVLYAYSTNGCKPHGQQKLICTIAFCVHPGWWCTKKKCLDHKSAETQIATECPKIQESSVRKQQSDPF